MSPDGRWLVYVPVERTVREPWARRSRPTRRRTLEAFRAPRRLGAARRPIALELPGQTGQPRVRDRTGARSTSCSSRPTRTTTAWSTRATTGCSSACRFSLARRRPRRGRARAAHRDVVELRVSRAVRGPAGRHLLQGASLDVYSLPLDGEVPADWTMPRLGDAIDDARHAGRAAAAREPSPRARDHARRAAARDAAPRAGAPRDARVRAPPSTTPSRSATLRDEATAGISMPLRMLVEQRRAERRREQGRMMGGFRREAQQRLDKLRADAGRARWPKTSRHLVRSEIVDSSATRPRPASELEAVTVDETTPAPIVEAYYEQADALYRELDDREALVAVCRKLVGERRAHARRAAALRPRRRARDGARDCRTPTPTPCSRASAPAAGARERGAGFRDRPRARRARAPRRAPTAGRGRCAARALRRPDAPRSPARAHRRCGAARRRRRRRRRARRAGAAGHQGRATRDARARRGPRTSTSAWSARAGLRARGREALRRRASRLRRGRRADRVARGRRRARSTCGSRSRSERAAIEARYASARVPRRAATSPRPICSRGSSRSSTGTRMRRQPRRRCRALDASWPELKDERMAQALFGALLHEEYLQTRRPRDGRAGQPPLSRSRSSWWAKTRASAR